MKARVLHMTNTRDGQFRDISEIRAALEQGNEFYLAGEVEVPDAAEIQDDVMNQLETAWTQSQNDCHPNAVLYRGNKIADSLNSLPEDTQAGIMHELAQDREGSSYQVLPAKWNGQFPQRSSMVGDVVVLDDNIYAVVGCGFEWVAAAIILGKLVLAENSYAPKLPEINHEFDQLITD
jgi:hypothetical protein